jgi:PAS domain S-box-containing protein
MGRATYLLKRQTGPVRAYDSRAQVNTTTESIVLNALPLLVLAAAYFGVAATLVPAVWRQRAGVHPLDVAVVTIFPAVGFAAAVLGAIVAHDQKPLGGHVWLIFAAAIVALLPALVFVGRWGDRGLVAGGIHRAQAAEERISLRDRELEALSAIAAALARAPTLETAARPLVEKVTELLDVGFGAVVLVDPDGKTARGVIGLLDGEPVPWWSELELDLLHEPSGIASAVFDAAPVTVYDAESSPRVSARLVEMVGAQSGAWIPIIAVDHVVGVLVAASTTEKRAFTAEELALLQTLAAETAMALERMHSAAALEQALERERLLAEIGRRIRSEHEVGEVIRAATKELRASLQLESVAVELGPEERAGVPVHVGATRHATIVLERKAPFSDAERFLVDTVARELGLALETARLLDENQRRLGQQSALLHAAQVVTSELELDVVLERLVQEVTKLLDADGADCYLYDPERGVLRCAAVHGLDASLVGFEFTADKGVAGVALRRERPVASAGFEDIERIPHPEYAAFSNAVVAPMVWAGAVRGVLGVGLKDAKRCFGRGDCDLLEAFAGLASLALRNAESFAERTRQAGVQRAFYRIASLLAEPVSLAETLTAAAQAAAEALGADVGLVLMADGARLAVVGAHELPPEMAALELPRALVEAAADGRTIAAPRLADDDRLEDEWRGLGFASLLAIPIEDSARGLVVVLYAEPHAFSVDDLELARQLGQAARGALERSRAYETERRARTLSQQLAQTTGRLSTELDPGVLLEALVEDAVTLLRAEAGSLAALDGDELEITAVTGEGAEDALGTRAPSTGWFGGDVLQLRAPVVRDDVEPSMLHGADAMLTQGYRAYVGVPVAGREGALHGVLAVYARDVRHWLEDEVEVLAALAANASVALSNAELYQRLALEHEQSVAILSNVADGIVAVDRDGRVVVWNAAAERITGVPAPEALGRTPATVLQRELESESGGTNRLVPIMRGTDEVWLSLSEALMRDPAGAVAGRIFAFRDISGERLVEQMKSDFVSTVSHELRTPLTSIYGFAETLLRRDIGFSDAERETFLRYIASESERLTRIVDALLNVARLDSGNLEVALVPTDVCSLLNDAVADAGSPADNHQFVVEFEDDVPPVQADPDKLRQVVDQLVENAVKFTPGGGLVRLEARKRPDAVEITVADEGAGIAAAQIGRIFDKFYRASDSSLPGTGLGLFIAQGLVSAMGGRIWVNSEEGAGSRFTFALPVANGTLK